MFEQDALVGAEQARLEQGDDRGRALGKAGSRLCAFQRKIGLEQVHQRVLPLRARGDRPGIEHAAMHRVEQPRIDERRDALGKVEQRGIAVQPVQPGDREQHEGVGIGIAHIGDDAAIAADREGEARHPVGFLMEVAQQRCHRGFGKLATAIGPAQLRRMREDVDLARLHHRPVRNVDRRARRVEPLAKARRGGIEARAEPDRQCCVDDPVHEQAQRSTPASDGRGSCTGIGLAQ